MPEYVQLASKQKKISLENLCFSYSLPIQILSRANEIAGQIFARVGI